MKKLLNTLYVTMPDAYLALDGENVVVRVQEEEMGRFPLHNFENIVTFGRQGASPALMRHVCELGIGLSFHSGSGRFLCRTEGEMRGNVLLRREQYRIADSEERSLKISINMIGAKTANSRKVLMRAFRDHPMLAEQDCVRKAADQLQAMLEAIRYAETPDTLRGMEGASATIYFSVMNHLILQQKDVFFFETREKRPPTDPVNAMLSFCYTLLANECASALYAVGLDPYVGFLHTDRPGRTSLALDLMEELRSVYCDRFVISLINLRQVKAEDFTIKENGAVLMSDETRKRLLTAWQKKKQDTIEHPYLGEKCSWGLLPYLQAQLLVRHIRGDMEEYPPYLWR